MTDDPDDLDAALAEFRRLEEKLARAIAACQRAHDRGEIGFDEYRAAKAAQEHLLAFAKVLGAMINAALATLAPTSAARDENQWEASR